jgi:hypothetical protein
MAKQVNEPIQVILDADRAAPVAFLWGDRRYRVCHVDACWKQVGAWWNGDGERTVFRVSGLGSRVSGGDSSVPDTRHPTPDTPTGIYELVHDHATGQWFLAGILD